jgi:hypothetical protein
MLNMIFKRHTESLKCFFDENRKLNYLRQVDRDIRPIKIDKIKGSVGRCLDFDAQFHSKSSDRERGRARRLKHAMEKGEYYPVIELFKLGDDYYVLDGHHRISAARELGYEFIDAHVVEYLPSKNGVKIQHDFEERTGLKGIQLTRKDDYKRLLSQIEIYQANLARENGDSVPFKEAGRHWFENIYKIIRDKIEDLKLDDQFPEKTIDDIFVQLCDQMHLRLRKQGRYEASLETELEKLHLLCKAPSSKETNHVLREKIKKIFLPCFYTGKCEF